LRDLAGERRNITDAPTVCADAGSALNVARLGGTARVDEARSWSRVSTGMTLLARESPAHA
jgi:hypothetical protein